MFDPKKLDEIAKKLTDALPAGLKEMKQSMEDNFRSILHSAFAKLDLVTREELDVQINVLARTREKLDLLEKKLTSLELELTPPTKTKTKNKSE